jgi:hypothetical protein
LDFVEEGHQPDHLDAKHEVRLVSLRAETLLGIELDVRKHYAVRVREDWFAIANC